MTFSRTVICPNNSTFWKVRTKPSLASFSGANREMFSPKINVPGILGIDPADDIEKRGLAGPVGADDSGDCPVFNGK